MYLLGTVYFTHQFGCQKCFVRGKRLQNRMCYRSIDAEPRTDANFRQPNAENAAEIEHIREHSILQALPIDMVKQFIIADALHLLEFIEFCPKVY